MASSPRLPPPLLETLKYFDKYDYPLTADELWYWQHGSNYSKRKIKKIYDKSLSPTRIKKEKISQRKWEIAKEAGERLKKVPTVWAVFVTGALAMNNCPADDDIDLMIITAPNTLWLARFFEKFAYLSVRRKPNVKKAPDKICPNLWLDTQHLKLNTQSLYIAHEILQAKCIFDRGGVHQQFLTQNSWVKRYLPIAYKSQIANLKPQKIPNWNLGFGNWVLRTANLFFFILQFVYMLPKMTTEKVGLGFAFFHPNQTTS